VAVPEIDLIILPSSKIRHGRAVRKLDDLFQGGYRHFSRGPSTCMQIKKHAK
jgi:hypothetical protein